MFRGFICARVGGVKSVDVRQQDQQVCADHLRGPCGEAVIIAISNFICGDCVILINNRHSAEL